jgi:hypothetical protein
MSSILHVGHDPSTGAVISVGGVTVLGIRGAYTPPIISARRKFGSDKTSLDYSVGKRDGEIFCEKKWAVFGSRSPAEIREMISRRPSDAAEVSKLLAGKSAAYQKGFYEGKEACEKKHFAALDMKPKFGSGDYETGRGHGTAHCRGGRSWREARTANSGKSADWQRGFDDGLREAGCDPASFRGASGMVQILTGETESHSIFNFNNYHG